MNDDLYHYGIRTAFVAVVAASAIFGLSSQISTATQSNAGSDTTQAEQPAERTVRVILDSPYGR